MKYYFSIALFSVALTGAQTLSITIQPPAAGASSANGGGGHAGSAILGYTSGPGPLDLREIDGTGKSAQIGAAVPLPRGVQRVIVPPRQHYLLLESANDPLAVWHPNRPGSAKAPVVGAFPHPDSVTFSARGDAALLYAKSTGRLQVISGLPAEPVLTPHSDFAQLGEAEKLAISDDGSTLAVLMNDGSAYISKTSSGQWTRLPAAYNAGVLLFVPNTAKLAMSDLGQKTIALISNPGDTNQTIQIVAHGLAADRLAFTKEGDVLVAASSAENKIWSIDLLTHTSAPVWASSIDALLPLRDGHTFLVSAGSVSLLNVPVESEKIAPAFVPVLR